MHDFQAVADRVEIEALRGEFSDAVMMNDHDGLASRCALDGDTTWDYAHVSELARDGGCHLNYSPTTSGTSAPRTAGIRRTHRRIPIRRQPAVYWWRTPIVQRAALADVRLCSVRW